MAKRKLIPVRTPTGQTVMMDDEGSIDLDKEVVVFRGKRLTEKRAEALVEEIHRRDRGRPSLSGGKGHSPRITFRVRDARTYDRITQLAEKRGVDVSEVVRLAVEKYVGAK